MGKNNNFLPLFPKTLSGCLGKILDSGVTAGPGLLVTSGIVKHHRILRPVLSLLNPPPPRLSCFAVGGPVPQKDADILANSKSQQFRKKKDLP